MALGGMFPNACAKLAEPIAGTGEDVGDGAVAVSVEDTEEVGEVGDPMKCCKKAVIEAALLAARDAAEETAAGPMLPLPLLLRCCACCDCIALTPF